MATSLGSQLRRLAITQGKDEDAHADPRGKPSLLFSPSDAANVDLLTIYDMARAGLEELSEMDSQFEPFKNTIFNEESTQIDRELQMKEFNDKLDISLSNYLRLLSSYFLLPPAHQTLEYLIRRYKIHVYNVDDLCTSMIPYHETSIFVRIVQILHLKKTCWAFLVGVRNSGAAPPRSVLVQQCIKDMALLETICGVATIGSRVSIKSKLITSFAMVILMETLASVSSVSNEIVTRMLPFVLQSFEKGASEDHKVGALMVVGALVSKTTLSASLIDALFNSMAKGFQPDVNEWDGVSTLRLPLMVMVQITQMQKMENFPLKAFKFLVKVRELPDLLIELSKKFDTKNFLSLFVKTLIGHSVVHQHYEELFAALIRAVPLKDHIELILSQLVRLVLSKEPKESNSSEKEVVKRLLLLLKDHFPDELGVAINAFLKDRGKNKTLLDQGIVFLGEVFSGSLLMPVAESRSTLLLSFTHEQSWIREQGFRQLVDLMKTPSTIQSPKEVQEILLRSLYDSDLNIVRTTLMAPGLVKLFTPERIFQALVTIIRRCTEASGEDAGHEAKIGNFKVVAKLAFKVLLSEFLNVFPDYLKKVTSVVFGHLLVSSKSWKLHLFIMQQAIKFPSTIFANLEELETELLQRKGTTLTKDEKRAWLCKVNTKIIAVLSTNLLENTNDCFSILRKASVSSHKAKSLSYLVVYGILERRLGVDTNFVKECLDFLREEWEANEAEVELPLLKLSKINYDAAFPTPDLYDDLERQHRHVHLVILLHDYFMLLRFIKETEQGTQLSQFLSELLVLFASSAQKDLFNPHIKELLHCFPNTWMTFLREFFVSGPDVPAAVQVYSLDILATQLSGLAPISGVSHVDQIHDLQMNVESCMPSLLVALSSPVKAVRRSATDCIAEMNSLMTYFEKVPENNDYKKVSSSHILPSNVLQEFVRVISLFKEYFVSDEKNLEAVLTTLFPPSGKPIETETCFSTKDFQGLAQNIVSGESLNVKAIMSYLLHYILLSPPHAQRVLLVALNGTGYTEEKYLATSQLLDQLLKRRQEHMQQRGSTDNTGISQTELLLLNALLEVNLSHVSATLRKSRTLPRESQTHYLSAFFRAINVDSGPTGDSTVVQPCLLSLKFITTELFAALHTSIQDNLFQILIDLSTNRNEAVHVAASKVMKQLDVPSSSIARHLDLLYIKDAEVEFGKTKKRKTGKGLADERSVSAMHWPARGKEFIYVTALLECLLSKPCITDREKLWGPLFGLLKSIQQTEFVKAMLSSSEVHNLPADEENQGSLNNFNKQTYFLHLLLIILEKLANSALTEPVAVKRKISKVFDVGAVVTCIKMATDKVTRNYALALLTSAGKLFPEHVLNYVSDIVTVVGESMLTQDDSHSEEVMHEIFAALIPSWLSSNRDPEELLQIFFLPFPKVPIHRRVVLAVNVLRMLGEETGLHLLIYLLLQQYADESASAKTSENVKARTYPDSKTLNSRDWRVVFSQQLCRHYAPNMRLQALVQLLDLIYLKLKAEDESSRTGVSGNTQLWLLQQSAAYFIAAELKNLEYFHQDKDDEDHVQRVLITMMEQALLQLHLLGADLEDVVRKVRKDSQNAAYFLLDSITKSMYMPSFCKAVASLLKHKDLKIRRKVLQLYIAKIKEGSPLIPLMKEKSQPSHELGRLGAAELYTQIIYHILELLTNTMDDASLSTKQTAVVALDLSAKIFAVAIPNRFISCFSALALNIKSQSKSLVAASIKCAASIMYELGSQCLSVLPEFFSDLLKLADDSFVLPKDKLNQISGGISDEGSELVLSLLVALRVVVDKLGYFLSPYLVEIVRLVVLHPQIFKYADKHSRSNSHDIHILLAEKIPARLLLDPLISNYSLAIESGTESTCLIFHTLAHLASKLDKASVVSYHGKIFELCMAAFDTRRKAPKAITSVSLVEKDAIAAFMALVMKLSESTLRPLFVTMTEWAETQNLDGEPAGHSIHRNITFYRLVNELQEKLRSVFVPYFQYLIESCVSYLTSSHVKSGLGSTKKKRKIEDTKQLRNSHVETSSGIHMWHLRALVISALHKCFLYDNIGFLDSSRFQLLLEPVVSQMVLEEPSPSLLAESPETPTVSEVDELLVMCLGQMALTAGTDALWKPLNHEVLMQTRSENIRARRLGLLVVKYLAERLKEEYLVLLPETIPFLAELLEDEDLSIIAKTQEVIKILEELSGESISQYL